MADLKNKVVIITGASGGIGGATAIEFANVGARLCITGRNEERLNQTKTACVKAGLTEENIVTVIADVTKKDDVAKIVAKTVEKFQQIDVLVNNAGAVIYGQFQDTSSDALDDMYNLHVKSVFALSRAALPFLIQSKGSIVNVSSRAGTRPTPSCFAYSAAKGMVDHMTQMMALELGPKGVRVNSVNPGVIMTDIFVKPGGLMADAPDKIDEFYKSMAAVYPMRRVGKPEEVAKPILFLASEASAFISSAIVLIDGAMNTTSAVPTIEMAT